MRTPRNKKHKTSSSSTKTPKLSNLKNLKTIIQAAYSTQPEAQSLLGDLGYKYDNDLSSIENKVFVKDDGTPGIVYRGSRQVVKDFLLSDMAVLKGTQAFDPRFQEAVETRKKTEAKYGKPAELYGHSLGGAIAEYVGTQNNPIVTVNKWAGPLDIGKIIPENQLDIRHTNDYVSSVAPWQYHNHDNLVTYGTGSDGVIADHKYQGIPDDLFG